MKFVPGLLVRPASPPHLPLTTPGLSITPDRRRRPGGRDELFEQGHLHGLVEAIGLEDTEIAAARHRDAGFVFRIPAQFMNPRLHPGRNQGAHNLPLHVDHGQ